MRRITTLLFAALAVGSPCMGQTAASSPTTATSPAPASSPLARVSAAQGPALVRLARSAMYEYIRHRTPATQQATPPDLAGLADRNDPVALTLRSNGEIVGQSIKAGSSLPVNLVTAALEAMRSPQLPDRVTRQTLDALTVEVEVLTRFEPVRADEIARHFVPGMSGLRLTLGQRSAYSLPSAGYEFALDAPQMEARCRGQLPEARSSDAESKWEVFTSMHFVGYPGKTQQTDWLYRGKILAMSEAVTPEKMSPTALNIGLYIRNHQAGDGCFTTGGERGGLGDHLYATYAMARLAKDGNKDFNFGANTDAAMKYARGFLKQAEGRAYLAAEDAADQLRATSMYILASVEAGANDPLREKFLATLMELSADGKMLPARLDGASAKPANAADQYIAFRAMSAALAGQADAPAKLAACRRTTERIEPPDTMAFAWKAWAGLTTLLPYDTSHTHRLMNTASEQLPVMCESELLDEQGGYCPQAAQPPQTVLTALMAVYLARKSPAAATTKSQDTALLQAQRFCYRMTYKSDEAYFASDRRDWTGAVRDGPTAATISLPACAAAIEALIAK